MKQSLLILVGIFFLVALKAFGQPVTVLDPDFFEKGGQLSDAQPGEFGCTSISAATPKGESGAVGRAVQNFCEGPAQIRWIPRSYGPTYFQDLPAGGYSTPYAYQVKGSYQVCCVRGGSGRTVRRRRPGPR